MVFAIEIFFFGLCRAGTRFQNLPLFSRTFVKRFPTLQSRWRFTRLTYPSTFVTILSRFSSVFLKSWTSFPIARFKIAQKFSIGFRSGECAGHPSTNLMPCFAHSACVSALPCTLAPSCIQ
jgi:hypothetical protein